MSLKSSDIFGSWVQLKLDSDNLLHIIYFKIKKPENILPGKILFIIKSIELLIKFP